MARGFPKATCHTCPVSTVCVLCVFEHLEDFIKCRGTSCVWDFLSLLCGFGVVFHKNRGSINKDRVLYRIADLPQPLA